MGSTFTYCCQTEKHSDPDEQSTEGRVSEESPMPSFKKPLSLSMVCLPIDDDAQSLSEGNKMGSTCTNCSQTEKHSDPDDQSTEGRFSDESLMPYFKKPLSLSMVCLPIQDDTQSLSEDCKMSIDSPMGGVLCDEKKDVDKEMKVNWDPCFNNNNILECEKMLWFDGFSSDSDECDYIKDHEDFLESVFQINQPDDTHNIVMAMSSPELVEEAKTREITEEDHDVSDNLSKDKSPPLRKLSLSSSLSKQHRCGTICMKRVKALRDLRSLNLQVTDL